MSKASVTLCVPVSLQQVCWQLIVAKMSICLSRWWCPLCTMHRFIHEYQARSSSGRSPNRRNTHLLPFNPQKRKRGDKSHSHGSLPTVSSPMSAIPIETRACCASSEYCSYSGLEPNLVLWLSFMQAHGLCPFPCNAHGKFSRPQRKLLVHREQCYLAGFGSPGVLFGRDSAMCTKSGDRKAASAKRLRTQ